MEDITYESLSTEEKQLIDAAESATQKSYSPQSGTATGVALRTKSGELILGTNYEVPARDSLCAEQAALGNANLQGHKEFTSMAIIAKRDKETVPPITPCGQCRQYLAEAVQRQGQDFPILLASADKKIVRKTSVTELLPFPFLETNDRIE
ncbi:cytidine deaminase [Patescibacteria group bacterium]